MLFRVIFNRDLEKDQRIRAIYFPCTHMIRADRAVVKVLHADLLAIVFSGSKSVTKTGVGKLPDFSLCRAVRQKVRIILLGKQCLKINRKNNKKALDFSTET